MLNLAVCYSRPGLASFLDISRLRRTLFQEAYALGKPDLELIEVNRICIMFKLFWIWNTIVNRSSAAKKLGSESSCRLASRTAGLAVHVVHVSASNMSTVFGDAWSLSLSESVDHVNNRHSFRSRRLSLELIGSGPQYSTYTSQRLDSYRRRTSAFNKQQCGDRFRQRHDSRFPNRATMASNCYRELGLRIKMLGVFPRSSYCTTYTGFGLSY